MGAIHKDIAIEIGANLRMLVWWPRPPDPLPVGWTPNDLSVGWKAFVQLRKAVDDSAPTYDLSAYATCQAGDVNTPNLLLDVPPSITLGMLEGMYQWSWWVGQTTTNIAAATYGKYMFEGTADVVRRSTR